jgi:nitrogen fixation protein NifB
VLSPAQALRYLKEMNGLIPNLSVVGIAGPGDPFAKPELTMETLELVNKAFPEMLLCVATNGFNLLPYVGRLSQYNVSHVTITVNAVDPEIGGKIYSWVRDGKCTRRGKEGAAQLLERQLLSIEALRSKGITVKINTIIIPGINDTHIHAVAKAVSEAGADIMNCIPLYPAADTEFEDMQPPSPESIAEIQKAAGQFMPLMRHCTRCRADAAGLLGEKLKDETVACLRKNSMTPLKSDENRPYVAVATREGMLVNQHLGEAAELWVYGHGEGKNILIAKRKLPLPGGGDNRWQELADTFKDCRLILAAGAGANPTKILDKNGIEVILMEGMVSEGLLAAFSDGDFSKLKIMWEGCGNACTGNGQGCG